jgi:ribosomal protein S1
MAKATTMDELLAAEGDSVKQLTQGDSIVGTVLSIRKHEVLVDLGAQFKYW